MGWGVRDSEQFKQAAIKNGITKWESHGCSICGYIVGHIFSPDYEQVAFDHGCDCTGRYSHSMRTWQDVADSYNMQKNEEVIKKMDEFWGFE
jgi:hypothetical protein